MTDDAHGALERHGARGAIVLAGGSSSRFGRDKLAATIDGTPMLDRAIAAVREVADDIVVVLAPEDPRPLPGGVAHAHDRAAFEGPLAGLAAGLAALPSHVERAIVVGGDMPALRPDVLALLLDALDVDPPADVAQLHDGERPRPLPCAVRPRTTQPAAERLLADGERRLRSLSSTLRVVVIDGPDWRRLDPSGDTLRDVDTPDDLAPPP